MEKIINEHEVSYSALFANVGVGNKLHVNLNAYTKNCVQVECTRQNKYAGCNPMNNKFSTNTVEKPGYITIYQRY